MDYIRLLSTAEMRNSLGYSAHVSMLRGVLRIASGFVALLVAARRMNVSITLVSPKRSSVHIPLDQHQNKML